MGKCCLHASSFIFDRVIIKVAGNQDRHKSLVEFDFGPNQITYFGVTCPWVMKLSHFWTWISLKPLVSLDQILFVASLGQGKGCIRFWGRLILAHWTQVSDLCPLGYLLLLWEPGQKKVSCENIWQKRNLYTLPVILGRKHFPTVSSWSVFTNSFDKKSRKNN